jgi:high-affinity nickel-transport protein
MPKGPVFPFIRSVTGLLFAVNIVIWIAALLLFRSVPLLLVPGLLAFGFGLRHAFDADHIAVIDNVTRRMIQGGKRPGLVGLYFALGHSTVVFALSLAIILWARRVTDAIPALARDGGLIGTIISVLFLLIVGVINGVILRSLISRYRAKADVRGRTGVEFQDGQSPGGLWTWLLGGGLKLINKRWKIYVVGFCFGLGFDTATEVGLLGLSASAAMHGVTPWAILILPILFTAGMTLLDTTDGLFMAGAYTWAANQPRRHLQYNIVVTAISVFAALLVGAIELAGLFTAQSHWRGAWTSSINLLNDHFAALGALIVLTFALVWMGFITAARRRGRTAPAGS